MLKDKENGIRGWTNGLLRNKTVDPTVSGPGKHNSHTNMGWLCSQFDLSSLLGELGDQEKSLNVFNAIEESLQNNHLAVGEWNFITSPEGKPDSS